MVKSSTITESGGFPLPKTKTYSSSISDDKGYQPDKGLWVRTITKNVAIASDFPLKMPINEL